MVSWINCPRSRSGLEPLEIERLGGGAGAGRVRGDNGPLEGFLLIELARTPGDELVEP